MRRMLHILKWIGLSLSTLLLAATVFCWVRSLGHQEGWLFKRFEPRPDWTDPDLAGQGVFRGWSVRAIHGRLWLQSWTWAPQPRCIPQTQYRRNPIAAAEAEELFAPILLAGEWRCNDGIERVWRFAGAGFRHDLGAIDPLIGRPGREAFDLALPFWMLAVVFGLWPVGFVAWRLLRKKRHAPGHCRHCGYDLRATPDPAGPRLPRCPECGRETADSAGAGVRSA